MDIKSFSDTHDYLVGRLSQLPKDKELRRRFENNCKIFMLASGLDTQHKLAKKIGVGKTAMSSFFTAKKSRQPLSIFLKIVMALKIHDVKILFDRDLVAEVVKSQSIK